MAGKAISRGEAISALCKARDDLTTAVHNLYDGKSVLRSWDTYCMDVDDVSKTAARLREGNAGASRGLQPEQVLAPAEQNAGAYADNPVLAQTTENAIRVLSNELACVMRQTGPGCDKNCAVCDLVLPDKLVISAYRTAIDIFRAQQEAERAERLKYPCDGCDAGWGAINGNGESHSCHETCEKRRRWEIDKAAGENGDMQQCDTV